MNNKIKFTVSLLTIGSCVTASPGAQALEMELQIEKVEEAAINRFGREVRRGVERSLGVDDNRYSDDNYSDYSNDDYSDDESVYYTDEYTYEEMERRSAELEESDSAEYEAEEFETEKTEEDEFYSPEAEFEQGSETEEEEFPQWGTENQESEPEFEENEAFDAEECESSEYGEEECPPAQEEAAEPNWSGTHNNYPSPATGGSTTVSGGGGGLGGMISDSGDQILSVAVAAAASALVSWFDSDDSNEDDYSDDEDEDYYNDYDGYYDEDDEEEEYYDGFDDFDSSDQGYSEYDDYEDDDEEDDYEDNQAYSEYNDYQEDEDASLPGSLNYYQESDGSAKDYYAPDGETFYPESASLTPQEMTALMGGGTANLPAINISNPINLDNQNNNWIVLGQDQKGNLAVSSNLEEAEITENLSKSLSEDYSRLKPSTANYLAQEEFEHQTIGDFTPPASINTNSERAIAAAPIPKGVVLGQSDFADSRIKAAPPPQAIASTPTPVAEEAQETADWAEISASAIGSSDSSSSLSPTRLSQGSAAPSQSVPEASPGWALVIGGGLFVGQRTLKNRRNSR